MIKIIRLTLSSLLLFFLFFFTSISVSAATFDVPSQYSTIQSAIDAAQTGDTVNVAAGTYNEAINFMGKDIHVHGAGEGISILDGSNLNVSIVSIISGESPNAVLVGFTLTNGEGTVWGNRRYGGALFVKNSSVTLMNIRFTNNSNDNVWGSAYAFYNSPASLIKNIEVIGNNGNNITTEFDEFSNVEIIDSEFSNNLGEGILISSFISGINYKNVLIQNNNKTILHVHFNDGRDYNPDLPVIFNSVILKNNNTDGNTLTIDDESHFIIINSELSNNISTDGLIRFLNSFMEIENSTIFNNINTKGAPYCDFCNSVITNVSDIDPYWPTLIQIKNTIVWGNSGPSGIAITLPSNSVGPISINYSLIQGGWPDTNSVGILDMSPLFVDQLNGDYHLTLNSPAIDTGNPNSPLDPDGTRADMGAYPFFHQPTPVEMVQNLVGLVEDFNFQQGISNSLDVKLDNALNSLNDLNENNNQAAINS